MESSNYEHVALGLILICLTCISDTFASKIEASNANPRYGFSLEWVLHNYE